jgi:putative MFS transporter
VLPDDERNTPSYRRKLFVFLAVATFFEGYDFFALTQILPNLCADFHIDNVTSGFLVGAINAGTIAAFAVLLLADRWGRRPVMALTIGAYTLFTVLTAASVGPVSFVAAQFLARMFLLAEWAVAMVYAAEEFPDEQRATVLGVVQGAGSLGAIVCAGIVPKLLALSLGWRAVYLAGAIPLVLMAFARRSLRETRRFDAVKAARAAGTQTPNRSFADFVAVLKGEHRTTVFKMAVLWALTYTCSQNAITFWKQHALLERHYSDAQVGAVVAQAAVFSIPLVFLAGKILDVLGRRRGAVVIYASLVVGVYCAFGLPSLRGSLVGLVLVVFGASAFLTVLNAFTSELFPTHVRADAFAWSNNLLGRWGYVLSPPLLGMAADRWGWGRSLQVTALLPALALLLMLTWLPETRGKALDT